MGAGCNSTVHGFFLLVSEASSHLVQLCLVVCFCTKMYMVIVTLVFLGTKIMFSADLLNLNNCV